MNAMVCRSCNWRFFKQNLPAEPFCPHCRSAEVERIDDEKALDFEQFLPFSVSKTEFHARVEEFSRNIPFRPPDLKPANLLERVEEIFLPRYLVDADVTAVWQAEMGFNYEVVSHQEIYQSHNWETIERKETRINWEPRVGRLARRYENVPAPALEDDKALASRLGEYSLRTPEPVDGRIVEPWVRVPDRNTSDAWLDAVVGLHQRSAEDCRLAAGADHVEQFQWQPEFGEKHWTLMLVPVYASYYLDDDGRFLPVLMNAQTGTLSGVRYASVQKARRYTAALLIIAAFLFGGSVFFGVVSPLFPIFGIAAIILFFFSVGCAIGAAFPVFMAKRFNSRINIPPGYRPG